MKVLLMITLMIVMMSSGCAILEEKEEVKQQYIPMSVKLTNCVKDYLLFDIDAKTALEVCKESYKCKN